MDLSDQQFAQMFREHKSTIYTVCYMFSKDEDEVEDLLQEALINLWKGFGRFDGHGDVRAWIYRVTLNTCISIDRKKKRRKAMPLQTDVNLFDTSDADNRQIEMLHRRIHRLPPFDRAVILLWLEDLSYEEIGAILGITAKNVSVRLYRIREQLKSMSNE